MADEFAVYLNGQGLHVTEPLGYERHYRHADVSEFAHCSAGGKRAGGRGLATGSGDRRGPYGAEG